MKKIITLLFTITLAFVCVFSNTQKVQAIMVEYGDDVAVSITGFSEGTDTSDFVIDVTSDADLAADDFGVFLIDEAAGTATAVTSISEAGVYNIVVVIKGAGYYFAKNGVGFNHNVTVTGAQFVNASVFASYTISTGSGIYNMGEATNNTLLVVSATAVVGSKVTYDANAGSDNVTNLPTDDDYYFENAVVNLKTTKPVREGYEFKGWALTENGTPVGTTTTMDSDGITLYAQWKSLHPVIGTGVETGNTIKMISVAGLLVLASVIATKKKENK